MLEDNTMPDDPRIAATEAGNSADLVALMKLGDAYARGIGVLKDPKKARECYIKAAKGGLAQAQRLVAVAFETVERDVPTAAKWYQRCAEQGDAECAARLAWLCSTGHGIPQDSSMAVKWYLVAAQQGLRAAQRNLARHFEEGIGVAQDDVEAVKWYRCAAEQGCHVSQYKLATFLASGVGIQRQVDLATHWFERAAVADDDVVKNAAISELNRLRACRDDQAV